MKIGDLVSVKGTTLTGKVIDLIDSFSICDEQCGMVCVMIDRDDGRAEIEIFEFENLEKLERQIGRSKE